MVWGSRVYIGHRMGREKTDDVKRRGRKYT
jgi:hypothetical protein